jgi:hypothetical protein
MKLRQAQYQYIVVTYVASPMKIGGANIDYNVLQIGNRFNVAYLLLYEVPTYLALNLN